MADLHQHRRRQGMPEEHHREMAQLQAEIDRELRSEGPGRQMAQVPRAGREALSEGNHRQMARLHRHRQAGGQIMS